jgi:phosphoenolpyruvate phosphomutase / 2-hydroxyethylphosphonate cytidylyltransferase
MKKVYMAISADFIHSGHLNILAKATSLGSVIVGVLSDNAIASYKRLPLHSLEERMKIIENLKGVDRVVIQNEMYPEQLLQEIKPDYVVHGDDWKSGPQKPVRDFIIQILSQWGGELVEVPYTKDLSSSVLANEARKQGTTPDVRLGELRRLLKNKSLIRILEVHNGLCGLITENTSIEVDGEHREFDGMWESSLTDSTSKGKPDTSAVDVSSRVSTIDQILDVTTKPMIVDADNGGLVEHFCFTLRTLERLGVSAVIIEDKVGPKRNSLFGTTAGQVQDTIEQFSHKISQGKKAQITKDFMIIARIESLIVNQGMEDAMARAKSYIKAGADGIMIHSRNADGEEIVEFCRRFKKLENKVPLVVVPSSFSHITEDEFAELGINIVIYANHLLRSAFPAMKNTAINILENKRCHEVSTTSCMSIKEIITMIPQVLD